MASNPIVRPKWPRATSLLAMFILWFVGIAYVEAPVLAQTPVAHASRVGGDADRARFVLDLDRPVSFRAFALADPYRVIVDLPEISFRLPPTDGKMGRGLISAYRYGLFAVGKSRIVIDLVAPVSIEKSFVLPANNDQPARLVIDLKRVDREQFMRQIQLARGTPIAPPPRVAVRPPGSAPKRKDNKLVVVIDPGHGGVDSGSLAPDGTREKDVVLAFSKVLAAKLRESKRYVPVLTRDKDIFLPLRRRVEFGREHGAALFISVHADKFRLPEVRGATIYTLSERASDAEAEELARGENRSDVIAGVNLSEEADEVTDILIDLAQRETKNFSVRFAQDAIRSMRGTVRLNKNPHRFAGFRVLKAPDVPSVLIELGFLSNRADVQQLQSSTWRNKTATALRKAVDHFFKRHFAQR